MAIRHCARCKSIFNYLSGPPICPKCKEKEEEDFKVVRKYLKQNEKATMEEVSKETKVSVRLINKFLREGRLEITSDSPIGLDCEKCGKRIQSGRYCKVCAEEMEKEFGGGRRPASRIPEKKKSSTPRMHFLNKDNTGRR